MIDGLQQQFAILKKLAMFSWIKCSFFFIFLLPTNLILAKDLCSFVLLLGIGVGGLVPTIIFRWVGIGFTFGWFGFKVLVVFVNWYYVCEIPTYIN